MRIDKSGSNPMVLYNNIGTTIHQLTLDHYERNVYWIESNQIFYVNVKGGEVKKFKINGSSNKSEISYQDIKVDEKYLYYLVRSNEKDKKNYLFRANKVNGQYDKSFNISTYYEPKMNSTTLGVSISKFIILPSKVQEKPQQKEDDISTWKKIGNWFDEVIG